MIPRVHYSHGVQRDCVRAVVCCRARVPACKCEPTVNLFHLDLEEALIPGFLDAARLPAAT